MTTNSECRCIGLKSLTYLIGIFLVCVDVNIFIVLLTNDIKVQDYDSTFRRTVLMMSLRTKG